MFAVFCALLVPGAVPTIDAPDFSKEVQVSAVTATVRVVNVTRDLQGSGAILGAVGPSVYVLTAAHLVEKTDRLEVQTFTANSYPRPRGVYHGVDVIARSDELDDLALLRFTTTGAVPGRLLGCAAERVPSDKQVVALSVGCSDGAAPTCVAGKVRKSQVRRALDGKTGVLWEAGSAPARGRSGGPLVDSRGYLIGICSGNADAKGYYAHAVSIHAFLKRNGLDTFSEGNKR